MAVASLILIILCLIGIVVSWGIAVQEGLRAESAAGGLSALRRARVMLWPFPGASGAGPVGLQSTRANKARVALIVAVTVAVAAASVHSNLTHVRPVKAASAVAPAPSKS